MIFNWLLIIIRIYYYIVFFRVIFAWINIAVGKNQILDKIYSLLYLLTEPVLKHLRRFIPSIRMRTGYLDLSPLVLLLLLYFIEMLLRHNLQGV